MKYLRLIENQHKTDVALIEKEGFKTSFSLMNGTVEVYYDQQLMIQLSQHLNIQLKQKLPFIKSKYKIDCQDIYYPITIEIIDLPMEYHYYKHSDDIVKNKLRLSIIDGYLRSNVEVFLNDEYTKEGLLKNFDYIDFKYYKIIYHDQFIACNFFCDLKPYKPQYNFQSTINTISFFKHYRRYVEEMETTITLKEPMRYLEYHKNPFVIQMGPALTMSLASLSVGGLTFYNALLNRRKIIEIIPMLILPITMFISTILWNPLQRYFEHKGVKKHNQKRKKRYVAYLEALLKEYKSKTKNILKQRIENYANINDMHEMIVNRLPTLFQRLPSHSDFLTISLGFGQSKEEYHLKYPNTLMDEDELHSRIEWFKEKISRNEHSMFILDLKKYRHITLCSKNEYMFKYILLQLVCYHGYDVLQIIVLCDLFFLKRHPYLNTIPFVRNKYAHFVFTSQQEYQDNYIHIQDLPTIVFVQSCNFEYDFSLKKLSYVHLVTSKEKVNIHSECIIYNDQFHNTIVINGMEYQTNIYDLIDIDFNTLNLYISNTYLNHNVKEGCLSILDIQDLTQIERNYRLNKPYHGLKANLGKVQHTLFQIDLHEKGMGPHGLIAGSTGSGKSELLITLILSLAMNYHPSDVQFIIIDYKGGGISLAFENDQYVLPHLVGSISNIQPELIQRSILALKKEVQLRQEAFKKMIDRTNEPVMNIDLYQQLYKEEYELIKLSHLIVVADEFAELKKQQPEFIHDLISISRIGRSLGIHLLLATQKPSGVVDDQIWSNARFKLCLKVQTAQDSKEMIESNVASMIKHPGEFYFLCDQKLKFAKAALSTMNIENPKDTLKVALLNSRCRIEKQSIAVQKPMKKEIDCIMQRIIKHANQYKARSIWQKPLTELNQEELIHKYQYDVKKYEIIMGEIDYIDQAKQGLFIHDLKQYPITFIFSLFKESRHRCIENILTSLSMFDYRVIFIDFNRFGIEDYLDYHILWLYIDGYQKELIQRVFHYLMNNQQDTLVIINGYHVFKELYPHLQELLLNIMANYSMYALRFMIFTTISSSISFNMFQLASKSYVIGKSNTNELMAIYNKVIKTTLESELDGINYTTMPYIFKLCKPSTFNYQKKDIPFTLEMPKTITMKYEKSKLLLGIDEITLQAIYFDFTMQPILVISSLYDDLLTKYKRLLNKVTKIKIIDQYQEITNLKEQQIILLNPYDYNKSILKNNYFCSALLWLGDGYQQQFTFHIPYKDYVEDNQGLYCYKGKIIKICYANEYYDLCKD